MIFSKFNVVLRDPAYDKPILFNTLYGSTFFISNDVANAVESKEISFLNNEAVETLYTAKILIDDNCDENAIFTYYRNQEKYGCGSLSSTVFLTWACNLRCVYCFQNRDHSAASMNLEMAKRYINFLQKTAIQKRIENIYITLFGGEPLLNFDVGLYILDNMKNFCDEFEIRFGCGIITNGTLLTNKIVDKLIQYSCDYIQITLDGVQSVHDKRRIDVHGHGSYADTIKAIKLLNTIKETHTVIRINIDKSNLESTYELLDEIGKKGLNLTKCHVDFGIVKSSSSACSGYAPNCLSKDEAGDVLVDLWKYAELNGFRYHIKPNRCFLYCGLCRDNSHSFLPDGSVYKCWEHAGLPEHLMGRIDERGVFVDQTPAFYRWMTADPLNNKVCKDCAYLPVCGGGCGVLCYNASGTYDQGGCCGARIGIEKEILRFVNSQLKRQSKISAGGNS